jgi:2Fe-2S ferredoxin
MDIGASVYERIGQNVGFIRSHGIDGGCVLADHFRKNKNDRPRSNDPFPDRFPFIYSDPHLYVLFDGITGGKRMLELIGRKVQKTVEPETGLTLLDHALKHKVDWGFSCTRGTCARCRCLVTAGMENLEDPTEEEDLRLEPEELEQGFRLGCQAKVKRTGAISVIHRPYF